MPDLLTPFRALNIDDNTTGLAYPKDAADTALASLNERLKAAEQEIAALKDKCQMHDFFWEGCGLGKRGFKNSIAVAEHLDNVEADMYMYKKAMYRAIYNWAHARAFIYMQAHHMKMDGELPRQWRRALELARLGYNFAEIAASEHPRKPKPPKGGDNGA